jgi:hypothetical protein
MEHARATYMITARAREHHAREIFDLKHVKQAIEQRAADGYRDLRLAQKYPFDLSRSSPARALEDWLEANQYRYVWSPTPSVLDPLHSPLSEDYPELAIFW